jgi:two-component system chemotaxis response regulator CheY
MPATGILSVVRYGSVTEVVTMRQRRVAYHSSRVGQGSSWPIPSRLPRDLLLSSRVNSTLLVDEKRTSIRLISDLFSRLGFGVIESTHSAEEALGMLKEKKYGLVLAEWDLEPMSGLQLLRAVKGDEKLRRTPVLITAAHLTCEQVILARRTGADALILKPFLVSALRAKIEEITVSRKNVPHVSPVP